MKFNIYILLFLIGGFGASACDICGCGAGTNYLGVLPQYSQNLVGTRFQYSSFLHPNTNFNTNDLDSRVREDRFYKTDFWLRYYPAKKLQLFAYIPYAVHTRLETERTTTIQGLGDINLNLNYTLVDYGDSITSDWKNLLLVGGGVVLPTGKYMQRDDTKLMLPAAFQIGTGAFSYSLNVIHSLRYRTWGLNTNLRYTFRGENELSYDYGNVFNGAVNLFYWGEAEKLAYLPTVGVSVDHFEQDYQYQALKPYTGGTLINFNAGVDLYINRFLINTFVQVPLSQDIPSEQPSGKISAGAGISMFFGKEQ